MDLMHNKNQILSLIKSDLFNYKLVAIMSTLGQNSDEYDLQFDIKVLKLIGVDETSSEYEPISKRYFALREKALFIDFSKEEKYIDELALEIYINLTD